MTGADGSDGAATLSVLMPNYNHGHFLEHSLSAILSQSYSPVEVLVLDDASTDNSVQVIEEIARADRRVQLIRNAENIGVVRSNNRLIGLARGTHIYMASADNEVLPGFFQKSMTLLERYPQAGLCSTVTRMMDESGTDLGVRALPVIAKHSCYMPPSEVRGTLLRYGRWIDSTCVIHRRDALLKCDLQMPELASFADTHLNLLIALRFGACYVPEPLTSFRRMSTGYSSSIALDWERLAEIGEMSVTLMRTAHRDYFPEPYVRKFERHWKYMVMVSAIYRALRDQHRFLDSVVRRIAPRRTVLDAAFTGVVGRVFSIQAVISRVYALSRFGTWDWWIRGRRSILLRLRRVAIRDRFDIREVRTSREHENL